MENGEKVEREREKESHGILSSPRLLKMYTEMIASATTIAGGCVIYLRILISTSLALIFLLPSVIALGFLYVIISKKLIVLFDFNFPKSYTCDDVLSQISSSKINILSNKLYVARKRVSLKFTYSATDCESVFNPRCLLFPNVTNI